jgi:hypothetical protein
MKAVPLDIRCAHSSLGLVWHIRIFRTTSWTQC